MVAFPSFIVGAVTLGMVLIGVVPATAVGAASHVTGGKEFPMGRPILHAGHVTSVGALCDASDHRKDLAWPGSARSHSTPALADA